MYRTVICQKFKKKCEEEERRWDDALYPIFSATLPKASVPETFIR